MAILTSYPCDGTPGATVTAANSGFAVVSGTIVYDTTGTAIEVAGSVTAYGEDQTTGDYCAIWFSVPAIPTGTDECIAVAMNGATTLAAVRVRSAGNISIYSGLGTLVATTTTVITAGTQYRLEWNTRTDGQELRLYTATGSTVIETLTGAVAAASPTIKRRLGHPQSAQSAGTVDIFKATINDSWPDAGNHAPTANAGADQINIAAGATVTLNGTGSSDPDGDPLTYAWTQTSGDTVTLSNASAARPTFTAPATASPQTLTFSLIVTDSFGAASAADTVSIDVLATVAPSGNLKIRISGSFVAAVEKVRIGGSWVTVTGSIVAGVGDSSVYSDTYADTY